MQKHITAYLGHKLLALALCGLLILAAIPLSAQAAEESPQFVLMNISYADFYQAELSGNEAPVAFCTGFTENIHAAQRRTIQFLRLRDE